MLYSLASLYVTCENHKIQSYCSLEHFKLEIQTFLHLLLISFSSKMKGFKCCN